MLSSSLLKKHPEWAYPTFDVKEFSKKKNKYAVCVFVINEGAKVRSQLNKMRSLKERADIIVADGGSTDKSLGSAFLQKVGVTALLTKTGPGKLSAQMRMAFAYILDAGYMGVIVVDGNNKDDTSAIPDFIRLLDKGYDHVQGSRFIKNGKAINTPISRLLAVRLFHSPLISLASRFRYTDTTNGFRAYSKRLLTDKDFAIFRGIFSTYELHYYLAIESARSQKYKVIETPVTRKYPKHGSVPTKISPLKGNLLIFTILIRAVFGRYRPKKNNYAATLADK